MLAGSVNCASRISHRILDLRAKFTELFVRNWIEKIREAVLAQTICPGGVSWPFWVLGPRLFSSYNKILCCRFEGRHPSAKLPLKIKYLLGIGAFSVWVGAGHRRTPRGPPEADQCHCRRLRHALRQNRWLRGETSARAPETRILAPTIFVRNWANLMIF